MSEERAQLNAERIENILRTSEFFAATSTRRKFMQRILATGGGVALGGVLGGAVLSCDATSTRATLPTPRTLRSLTLATPRSVPSVLASHSTAMR
jgi:hypothetical protein